MKLGSILGSVAKKLLIDFAEVTSQLEHRGLKGTARERSVVEEFLRKYLPPTVATGHGEIISSNGGVSNECDVVVYDRLHCPPLVDMADSQIFAIESVYAAIEVKSKLDSRELADCLAKIQRIKSLPKVAYEPQRPPMIRYSYLYGREWPYTPTLGFVFAYDSTDLVQLRVELDALHRDAPLDRRIDSIWVLKKGFIANWDDSKKKLEAVPSDATRMRVCVSDNPLLIMTVHLHQILQEAWMPDFRIRDYLSDASWGTYAEP